MKTAVLAFALGLALLGAYASEHETEPRIERIERCEGDENCEALEREAAEEAKERLRSYCKPPLLPDRFVPCEKLYFDSLR